MANVSQRRAVAAHRRRLTERGLGRFEVRGFAADKTLIRELARRLSTGDDAAAALRAEVARHLAGGVEEPPETGRVLAALRRSPLVGADIDLARETGAGRDAAL